MQKFLNPHDFILFGAATLTVIWAFNGLLRHLGTPQLQA